jgi:inosine/xanthosine triphosphatase
MKTIVLASNNPVKVQAALNGFCRMFPEEKFQAALVSAASEVSDQPMSDKETLRGALNRARNAARLIPSADYWVGIEGGVEDTDGEMAAFAWVVVCSQELIGKGRTGTFFLPVQVADLIRQGKELGEADDLVFNRSNSKQDNGAVGLLTGNVIDRAQLYEQAVILALAPFKNTEWYSRP